MARYDWLSQDFRVIIPIKTIIDIVSTYSVDDIEKLHNSLGIAVKNRVQTQPGIVLDLVQKAWENDRLFALVFQAMKIDPNRWDEYLS